MEPLDRKYRPQVFTDVLGQDGTVKVLAKTLGQVESEGIDPSIFFGPFGSGKTTLARIYARSVLCEHRQPDGSPCNSCESCIMFLEDRHPAYTEIDGANITKVEEFRKILDSTSYQVSGYKNRVFLIDECHMMSKASQNLFLKPLENGVPGVFWMFCTTDYYKILDTIRSRCVDYGIRTIPPEGMTQRVMKICETEGIPYDPEAVATIVSVKVHFRDVLKFVTQIRNIGGATSMVVADYLNIGVNDYYLSVLIDLRENPSKAMDTLELALERVSPTEVYNGIAQASMDAYKAAKGIRCSMVVRDPSLRTKVYEVYGNAITQVTSYLLESGNRRIDKGYLVSSLLLMGKGLKTRLQLAMEGGDASPQVIVREVIREVSVPSVLPSSAEVVASSGVEPTATPSPSRQDASSPKPSSPAVPILVSPEYDERSRRRSDSKQEYVALAPKDTGAKILSETELSLLIQRGAPYGR